MTTTSSELQLTVFSISYVVGVWCLLVTLQVKYYVLVRMFLVEDVLITIGRLLGHSILFT